MKDRNKLVNEAVTLNPQSSILNPVMLDLAGKELTPEEIELVQHPQVGGVILFSRNYESPNQIKNLNAQIRQYNPRLLIAVDQEGGRVQRFREGFTTLPPLAELSSLYQEDAAKAKEVAKNAAAIMARELIDVGITFSFAPVLDIDQGVSEIIGDRSFGNNAQLVVDLAAAYIEGMNLQGMPAVGKHFPGHGAVAADSHHELPVDSRDFTTILQQDLVPYQKLNQQLAGVMTAHIIYEKMDTQPASFSHFWITEILRKQLKFSGVIFSDDLSMAGASYAGNYAERARLALAAGCNMVLVCNNRQGAIEVVEDLQIYK